MSLFVECPAPDFPVYTNTSASDWIQAIRSYNPDLYCGYQIASYALQGFSDEARYYPFSTLSDYHTYWWVLTAFRSFVFFLLAFYFIIQRYEWTKSHSICWIGLCTWMTGITLIILIPAWNSQTGTSCFQYQNTEFLLDWSFGWMVWSWGCVQIIQKYFIDLHKYRFIGITLLFWIWTRQTYWMNWNNTSPIVEYATVSVLSYLVVWVAIMLLCEAELWYPIIGCGLISILWWTQQHVQDQFPYVQVTDDMNPWRIILWLGLSTLIIMGAITFIFMIDGLLEVCRNYQTDARRHVYVSQGQPYTWRVPGLNNFRPSDYYARGNNVTVAYSPMKIQG